MALIPSLVRGNVNVPTGTAAILPPDQFVACYPLISSNIIGVGVDLSTRPITHFDASGFATKWSADYRATNAELAGV